jgi:membrane-bound lytic murein transglycosylase D
MQNPFMMKFPWTLVAVLAANSLIAAPKNEAFSPGAEHKNNYRWSASIEGDVKQRLEQLSLPFEARYDAQVRHRIKDYVSNGYRDTESMLARSTAFFPVFEHYLHLYGLPQELRYLPIVETGLVTEAYSHAGAAGLWQFIPSSARLYGLKVNRQVDERLDPYRSTEAAVKMLDRLHDHYKDWSLVLAAYNCGPVRVNAAIRQAGCRDFYTIAEYLPAETRAYVPRFVAAAYIANFYSDHGLKPNYSVLEAKEVRAIRLMESLAFQEVSQITGIPMPVIKRLNPAFRQNVVPESKDGYMLLLPAKAHQLLKTFLQQRRGMSESELTLLYPTLQRMHYVVQPGDTMDKVNRRFQCTPKEVQRWNMLPNAEITVNQELLLFVADAGRLAQP